MNVSAIAFLGCDLLTNIASRLMRFQPRTLSSKNETLAIKTIISAMYSFTIFLFLLVFLTNYKVQHFRARIHERERN